MDTLLTASHLKVVVTAADRVLVTVVTTAPVDRKEVMGWSLGPVSPKALALAERLKNAWRSVMPPLKQPPENTRTTIDLITLKAYTARRVKVTKETIVYLLTSDGHRIDLQKGDVLVVSAKGYDKDKRQAMKITHAIIVTGTRSPDRVSLLTDLPHPMPVLEYPGARLGLDFNAAKGTGVAYVQQHFPGIGIEVISTAVPEIPFSKRG